MKYDIRVGDIYPSVRDGNFAIINNDGYGVFTIKFLNTNAVRQVRRSQIVTGSVKDLTLKQDRSVKVKYKAVLANGETLMLKKRVDVLAHLQNKCLNKLNNFCEGRCSHPDLLELIKLSE